jgi:hypothetical protein
MGNIGEKDLKDMELECTDRIYAAQDKAIYAAQNKAIYGPW